MTSPTFHSGSNAHNGLPGGAGNPLNFGVYTPPVLTSGLLVAYAISWSSDASSPTFSSCTLGATPLTHPSGCLATRGSANNWFQTDLFYLVAPANSPAAITLTSAGTTTYLGLIVACYDNVDQVTSVGTGATNTGGTTAASIAVGSVSGDLVVGVFGGSVGAGMTFTFDQTGRDGFADGANSVDCGMGETPAVGASTTLSGSWSHTNPDWAASGIALKGTGGVGNPALLFLH